MLQKSGVLALKVPHFWQRTSPGWNGSVMTVEPQFRQVVQAFQVAALALPVADCVIDKLQLRQLAKILDREDGLEYRLQSRVIALAGQHVHLQKAVIGALLHLDEVGNLDGRRDL